MAAFAATLLAAAAAVLLTEARSARGASGESVRLLRAELSAEHLLARALLRLDLGEPLAAQGEVLAQAQGGRVLRQDAAGLVDLNAAPETTLAALLVGIGIERKRAASLAAAIADWRDADDLKRVGGAERHAYAEAALPPPGNRPFETEGELARVLGVEFELLACALPLLTTYSGQADVDAEAAPPALRARLTLTPGSGASAGAPLGRVIALTAEAPLSQSAVLRRTLWLRLTGDPEQPILVHRAAQELAPRNLAPIACEAAAP